MVVICALYTLLMLSINLSIHISMQEKLKHHCNIDICVNKSETNLLGIFGRSTFTLQCGKPKEIATISPNVLVLCTTFILDLDGCIKHSVTFLADMLSSLHLHRI